MKRTAILILGIIAGLAMALTSRAETHFPELQNQKDVTRVYISKAMMKLAGTRGMTSGLGLKKGARIESMEVYSCESKTSAKLAREALDNFMKSQSGVETLVLVEEDNESTFIYGLPTDREDVYKSIIIASFELGEANLVWIDGEISAGDIKSDN